MTSGIDFDSTSGVYDTFITSADAPIYTLLDAAGNVFAGFAGPVMVTAAIYVALVGYSIMSGRVAMSLNEASVRISKLVLIIVFVTSYFWFAKIFYNAFWTVPTYVANFFLGALDPSISYGAATTVAGTSDSFVIQNPELTSLVDDYAEAILQLIGDFTAVHKGAAGTGFVVWLVYMAPVVAAMMIIIVAKIVSVLLFILAPLVFTASLIGYSNHFLLGWFRQLVVLSLTVIIAYILFVLVLSMVSGAATLAYDNATQLSGAYSGYKNITIPVLFPVFALSFIGLVLILQAPLLANRIIGAFGLVNNQARATSSTTVTSEGA
ncbi:hypothetical protein MNBD_ALPHA06-1736 [hydrothermal vent metagenome]|uniref:Type IV secretion system protein VirB6 n=1 Tax=hydrothermal vent metagenome TaxID=652676 RepID=A0A3B0S8X0_9ZZZZ